MTSHNNTPRPNPHTSFEFLRSQGEMIGHLHRHNWGKTALGEPSCWPDSLRAALSLCMGSDFPIAIYWGPEFLLLYNDAWSPILGKKHPWALGRPASEVWPEIWDTIGPMLRHVLATGGATRSQDQLLPMHRHGFTEECYFDYTFSPIYGQEGQVGGIFNIVVETTFRVIGERRTKLLRDLGEHTAAARTAEEACMRAAAVISSADADLPFCLLYLLDCESSSAKLAASVGLPDNHPARPLQIDLSPSQLPWPVASVYGGRPMLLLEDLAERFGSGLPGCIWPEPCQKAALLPFGSTGATNPVGVLVAGVSPRLAFDKEYEGLMSQVAALIGSAVNNANAYEGERRRAESLAELDRAKSAFFSNVSHELRTPLTLMLGPLEETLQLGPDIPPSARECLQVVHRNGLRLQRLVNSLLDFSRIEAGRMQTNLQPVDISTVTADLASNFRSAMERAGLKYIIECPPLPSPVYIDVEMWEKIVLNLLSNAFKFTHTGTVALRLSDLGSTFELSVSDTGLGIPENELPCIFERFHRAGNTHARTHEGTGIGLALAHELVQLHNGEISVSSEVGKGSTFRITVPYTPLHLAAALAGRDQSLTSTAVQARSLVEEALRWISTPAQQEPPSPRPQFGYRGRILLADDNADMREYLQRLLSQQYKVTAVAGGQEALASAIADPPDLVLSDIMMPGLDGIGLLRALRSHPATRLIPVLLLSARAGNEASAEGLKAGADDYIVKPFAARELLARVGSQLSRKQERQRAYELLSQVFAQAPVSICLLQGPQFVVELANSKFATLVSKPEFEGQMLEDVMPGLEESIWELLRRVLESGEPFVAPEIRVHMDLDHDGIAEDHWFSVAFQPLREHDGAISGVIVVGLEVTEQMRARQDLERANRELEEFAFVASHDMQEPLRMINSFTQLLVRRHISPDNDEAQGYGEFVQQGVRRMEQLIQDLLAYSRVLHQGQQHAQSGVADLNASWAKAVSIMEGRILESGALVMARSLPLVHGETDQIAQVFQNLLSNALKYRKSNEKARIEASATRQDQMWVIAVRDNGIGFEQKYAERIFGLFKRLHRDEFPGTGLGLAICQRIVERFGGRIWAESEPGVGSTFYFTLPAAGE